MAAPNSSSDSRSKPPGVAPVRSIADDLLALVSQVDGDFALPAVAGFYLPPLQPEDPARPDSGPWRPCNNFAALVLQDGTVGMTYTAIDDAQTGLQKALPGLALAGSPAIGLATLYAGAPGWERALGLAAVNAISQFALRERAQALAPCPDTVALLDVRPGDRIGMVGLFGRLVEPIREQGASLTVVELDAKHVRAGPGLVVTLDTAALSGCNKIIITGTTLLNGTLDALLARLAHAERICLVGPSASCLPEPLFARGLTAIGGMRIDSIERFMPLWSEGGRWREAGSRYVIEATRNVSRHGRQDSGQNLAKQVP